jgi:hypothetical protein
MMTLAVLVLLLVRPAWSAPRGTTDEEQILGRLQTICDDGTRAVSTDHQTLDRWETTITASPRQVCTGHLHPITRPVERRVSE